MKYLPPVSPLGWQEEELLAVNTGVYPNPVSSSFKITSSLYPINKVELFNVLGEKILHKETTGSNKLEIDLSQFSTGLYIVKVFTSKGIVTKKLPKE